MSAYSDAVLADNPALYFRLGDTSGTVCTDSSGNGRNGTYTAGFTLAQAGLLSGDPDASVLFDGTSGYVQHGGSWVDITSGDWTLEAWIYPTAFGAGHRAVIGTNGGGSYCMTISNGNFIVTNVNVLDAGAATTPPGLNATSHIAATFSDTPNTLTYYLNGQPNGSVTFATTTTAGIFTGSIGAREETGGFFQGRIDEAAVYTSALSAARILAHYNAGVQSGLLLPQWPRVRFNG